MILWAKLPDFGASCGLIFVIFVSAEHDGLKACLSPLPVLVAGGVVYEVVILKELLSIPGRILLHGVCVLDDFLFLLDNLLLLFWGPHSTAKCSLVVQWYLFFFLGSTLRTIFRESSEHGEAKRHDASRRDSVRPVNHAAGDGLLLLIVSLFFVTFGNFDHMLEVEEAAKGISVGLSLHHCQGFLVVRPFSVHRARPDMHLLRLTVFHVLLILHMLELLEVLKLLLVVRVLLLRHLLARRARTLGLLVAPSVDVVRLDLEVLFFLLASRPRLSRGRAAEDAVLSRRGCLVRSDVLSAKWVHSRCVILKSMLVVLLRLHILKLTLGGSWTFAGGAALDHVVVVTGGLVTVTAPVARGNARVARKVEQLLAEG